MSIIDELFAIDPEYSPLRPDWLEISNRLKKLNDTRVRLAHHTLGPGIDFEHFVASGGGDVSAIFPTLKPSKSDSRTKSKKHTPIGMEGLTRFVVEMEATMDKILPLMDRMEPIFLGPKQRLADQIKQLRRNRRLRKLNAAIQTANSSRPPLTRLEKLTQLYCCRASSSRSPPRNNKHDDYSGDDSVDAIGTDNQAKETDE